MSKLPASLVVSGFIGLLLAGAVMPEKALHAAPPDTDWSKAVAVTVTLSDFKFSPARLSLRVGVPIHLILVNSGSGEHDFSAPEFFSAVTFGPGGVAPKKGEIAVAKNETKDMYLLPTKTGGYELECTHFMHSMFGMHGAIEVTGDPG